MPARIFPSLLFLVIEAALIAVAALVGGPAWTGMMVLAVLAEVAAGSQLTGLAWLTAASGWLVAAAVSQNRELFFPFALALAAVVACRLRPRSQAAATIAAAMGVFAFLAIRLAQQATWQVLFTEAMVAGGILLVIVAGCRWLPERPWATGLLMATASALAYAGLSL
jgi:hypothetical protein